MNMTLETAQLLCSAHDKAVHGIAVAEEETVSTSKHGHDLGFYSTLVGEYDQRPGNYYVVSHRQGRAPEAGFHRLAGPFTTHREADVQVRPVREYAERCGGWEAFRQHYITARCEPEYAPKSFLGSDPTNWTSDPLANKIELENFPVRSNDGSVTCTCNCKGNSFLHRGVW